ncbi:MAG: DUF4139 domain-containing protein [Brevundimonas sp.]|uniref:DUF4139 domain-containing protein n=1 Tax=Brevundimonas sp. TaxID=1871086 RepID=UPI001A1DDC08|nr:DUF4139 domain-containing protein [Brevundimonas sp.]MBJ7448262.1 DUF4139 domain-containing protein [Brevundimonas sp.]
MIRWVLMTGTALSLLAMPAMAQQAQDGSQGPNRVSLTIYNQNVALVEDVRELTLPAGRSRREFPGVSASIRPETVGLSGRGLSVVEQNFDYDLLTPDKLMQAAVGDEIGIVRTNPGSGAQETQRARVLAANQGVVLEVDGRIEVLRDDGVPTRVIFDEVPANLRPRPTLSVTLDAEGAGQRDVTLTYLTTGLQWKADYVARFDERAGRLDLTGWITLTNQSGVTFANADTRVVAGDVSLLNDGGNNAYGRGYPQPVRPGTRGNGTEQGGAQGLADVYIYPLPEPVTVANNQTKQVGLIDVANVPASKRYLYEADSFTTETEARAADVAVIFSNSRTSGVGTQLPAGVARVYVNDEAGEPRFIGEDRVAHTPAGSDIVITTGQAFDVTVQPRVVSSEAAPKPAYYRWRTRFEMEYTVRNARSEAVVVEVRQHGLGRDTQLQGQSIEGVVQDADTIVWRVPVQANGETVLTATVVTGG